MIDRNRNPQVIRTAILLVLMLAMIAPVAALAEQITVEYSFEYPQITSAEAFDRVVMEGAPNSGSPGEPALPATGAYILLPYGTAVENIEVVAGDAVSLGTGYQIEPVSEPVKLSADPGSAVPPTPDPVIYASDDPFPGRFQDRVGTYGFRGYQILTLRLHPVQYTPSTGELSYYPMLTVVVDTKPADRSATTFRGFDEDREEVLARVDNPETAVSYSSAGIRGSKVYDLLIITTITLESSFQVLKDYHDTTGIATDMVTTMTIGGNDPDVVRDYIYDRYINDGITYVLIGGDDDLIPAKDLFVQSSVGGGDTEYDMPGDVYFGCLDGTWNFDGDAYWGEPDDGDFGGDVDLLAEVYVGRAAVGDLTEADRFVNKTIQYLTCEDPYLEKVLLVGEHLGFGGVSEYAGNTLDELMEGCDTHGYSTVGIPSSVYSIDRLFDRDYPYNDWPRSQLVNRINPGLHVVNHLGHGSPDYAMKLDNDQVLAYIANTNHCLVYSQTCLAGHFDNFDCWAEHMNIKMEDYGAFAVIMNARYGWGSYNSTDGPSQRFNREFWDAIFNEAENMPELGRANMDSKEDNLYRINDNCMRWCYYELNLFGDPTVPFKIMAGLDVSLTNGLPETIAPNVPVTIEVEAAGTYGGIPAPGTGELHYSIDGAEYLTVGMTEVYTDHYEGTLPGIDCGSTIEFYFTVNESSGKTFSYPQNAPDEVCSLFPTTDITVYFDDNCESSLGWTVSGDASDGHWVRGVPVGGGDRGDPATDFDGSGSCYLTDNVDDNSDVDDGTTTLVSPSVDLSGGDATVHYARWYSNTEGSAPNADVFVVYISNDDGSNWTEVETVGPVSEASGGWYEHTFYVSEFVTPTSHVRLRFDASDLGEGSVVEAAIDAISFKLVECNTFMCGDTDGNEAIDIDDVVFVINFIFASGVAPNPMEAADVDCSSGVDIDDAVYLIMYIFAGGPAPCAACD